MGGSLISSHHRSGGATWPPGSPFRQNALEETLYPRTRRHALLALLGSVSALSACAGLADPVIVPEFEFSFSFESGLDGWTPSSADVGAGTWAIEGSSERASAGARSARLQLANPGGAGKVWLTRELEVTPNKRYSVDFSVALATSDHGTVAPWKVIVGMRATPPLSAAELDFQGDTSSGPETSAGVVWAVKSFTMTAMADAEGRLFLTVGVWGTSPGTRTYWLDDAKVVLTRTE